MTTINERIKQIREACGMTTESFALKLGISRSTIEHIESGRNNPSIHVVAQICKHFPQYKIWWIIYGEGQMTEKEVDIPVRELGTKEYKLPEIGLQTEWEQAESITEEEVSQKKQRIEDVLRHFQIGFDSITETVGPSYTLYEITLAQGVRMGKVRCLEDDIALSIASVGIRIIAPIPGKGTLGIEIPHDHPCTIPMQSVAGSEDFQNTDMKLPMVLGMDVDGKPMLMDLAKAPHILIGGATGQGKSSLIHTLITSLLLKKKPDEMKFVIIDSKRTEYAIYETLCNHFLTGLSGEGKHIITDTDKAVQVLECLCQEMDVRYDLLKKSGCRNINEYNAKNEKGEWVIGKEHRFMPYIVLVVDDYADMMLSRGKDVELPLCRIAQLARAVGIHAIIATQRPTTNIITGTIKANFPVRIAFRVAAMMDSRTILDRSGAQQLTGPGDMLVSHGRIESERLQAVFTDRQDIKNIVQHISAQQSHTSTYPLPEDKVNESIINDENSRKVERLFQNAVRKAQFSSKEKEARQTIADLKRGIAMLESWMEDMDNEDFYLPNE